MSDMMAQTTQDRKRARIASATLDALDNDTLIRCASFLDVDGLVQLGRTSASFGIPQAGQRRSLVNEAAHQRFLHGATDEEKGCLLKYDDESDVGLYRALELSRQPLCFDELAGNDFSTQEHPAVITCKGRGNPFISTAMSRQIMRGGRHFVEFTIDSDVQTTHNVHLGVIRPVSLTKDIDVVADWKRSVNPMLISSSYRSAISEKLRSQRNARWGDSNIHCCAYYCGTGYRSWTDWNSPSYDWRGTEGLGDRGAIGLLLDLGDGILSVFKNGRRLGVVKDGLEGEYCWFVVVYSACTISISKAQAPH
ncbi:hypothetical protein THAOC_32175 [Thalassiosira oceanica]|uniref:B30.2/SPRY domain-containing protein n=1 Tax=Thalassiosira oceanica TaxID=159749 RepID=K0RJ90_THAOC|nr:hypothetical protein THAOC_32175 [Thalassiosira oceanica]|eukprot:EJK48986.1 hypothetical protein THAOC_32175 [Thalassiosira oceanica]